MAMGAIGQCMLVVVVTMTIVSVGTAMDVEGSYGRRIVVGGVAEWNFGFNYMDWAITTGGPFHVGDTLVFVYKPTHLGNITIVHNVYLLESYEALKSCNFTNAVLLADPSQGPAGFEFKLTQPKPYYFACSERAGFHCSVGQMRFSVCPTAI